jgi:hypothetical protein
MATETKKVSFCEAGVMISVLLTASSLVFAAFESFTDLVAGRWLGLSHYLQLVMAPLILGIVLFIVFVICVRRSLTNGQ